MTTPTNNFSFLTKDFNWSALTKINPDFNHELCVEILDNAEKFAKSLSSVNSASDAIGVKLVNGRTVTPPSFPALYKEYHELGWNSLDMPERFGGLALPTLIYSAVNTVFMSANLSFSIYTGLTHAAISVIENFASPALQDRFIPKMISGDWSGTMCLTEPHCGTDLALIKTRATLDPSAPGKYRITGTKIFISAGDHDLNENIIHLVLAKTDAKNSVNAISLFLVPKFELDSSPPVSNSVLTGRLEEKMGLHANATAELVFTNSIGYLIGEEGQGLKYMFKMMNEARLGVGLQSVALMERAFDMSTDYADTRTTSFDINNLSSRTDLHPISKIPDVKKMIDYQGALFFPSKKLCLYLAHLFDLLKVIDISDSPDSPQNKLKKNLINKEIALLTPIAKAFISESAQESIYNAMQIYGGHGYIKEHGIEQIARDARILPIYEGVNNIQYLDFTARKSFQQFSFYQKYLNKMFGRISNAPVSKQDKLTLIVELFKLKVLFYKIAIKSKKDVKVIFNISSEYAKLFARIWYGVEWMYLSKNKELTRYYRYYFDCILPRNKADRQTIKNLLK